MTTNVAAVAPPNQLSADLLSVCGLTPFPGNDSSNRIQMFSSHLSQKLVISGATERYIQTGMEDEFAKYTFSIKMPVDGRIIRIIDRYPHGIHQDAIAMNPETVIIYENEQTKEVGMISIPKYCSYHQYFGFEYKSKPALNMLVPGNLIPAGTILVDSPAVADNGGYKYGAEMNVALMSHPSVSEDGILISRDVLSRFSFKTYETRTVDFGSKRFALNMYGTVDKMKAFPDIGDYIRDDNILMMLRLYDKNMAPVDQSIYDLMEPDHIFDKAIYGAGPGGRIIDIRVFTNAEPGIDTNETDVQPLKYVDAQQAFYQEIAKEWRRLKKDRGDSLVTTPEFHRTVVESLAMIDESMPRVGKLYRQTPLDTYRVEFVIEYEITPTTGFKLTDSHGAKGVVCQIAEPWEMPVDEDGNRADIVMDDKSIVSRMNFGRLFEQYYNAASRDVAKAIRQKLKIEKGDKHALAKVKQVQETNAALYAECYKYLMGYYHIVTPHMYTLFTQEVPAEGQAEHLATIVRRGIYLHRPTDCQTEPVEVVKQLEKHYRPVYGPVTYIGNSGQRVTTEENVRIGSLYIMLLEKIGDDWSSLASGKLQHFGILAQVTKSDKHAQPTRNQPVRGIGESEARIFASYTSPRAMAELMDRNNNPAAHRNVVWSILDAPKPTNIQTAVNRQEIQFGSTKPLQLLNHITLCGGFKFAHSETE